MYVPDRYRADASWSNKLVRDHPLAILVTNGPTTPLATHLPVILPPEERRVLDPGDSLVGRVLFGHLNRLNPHWAALRSGDPAMLIFHGPNSYVSPTAYQVTPAAPTWNFTAVHVHGTLCPVTGRDATLQVVRWTAETFEADFGNGWDMRSSLDYFDSIVDGVGAFEFRVTSVEAMFKLSQEQPGEVRDRVTESFRASPRCAQREVGMLMSLLQKRESA